MPQSETISTTGAYGLVAGDIDNNGYPDILKWRYNITDNHEILLNRSGHYFDTYSYFEIDEFENMHSNGLLDYDLDGDLDIITISAWGSPQFHLLKNIGLNEDGIERTPFSSGFNTGVLLTTPSDRFLDLIQGSVDKLYDDFVDIVSRGRNLSVDQVNDIAKGRVWSGIDALDIGLVDAIGSFDDALNKAKELANIDDYTLKIFDQKRNDFTFLKRIFGLMGIQEEDIFSKNLFHNLQNDFLKTTKLSMNLNDPDNLYFLCDECIVKY